jgi:hypothetical protein
MTDVWTGTGADYATDPLTAGIELARQRLRRHGVDVDPADLPDTVELARSFLRDEVADAPARAQELVAEAVMLAGAMRAYYGEPGLRTDQVARYVDAARPFFNSFWHET